MPSGHDASRIVDENGLAPTVKENHGTVTAVLQKFEFPSKQELKLKLKDILESEVDEKYYLSDEMVNKIRTSNFMQERKRIQEKECCDTLLARDWKDPKCVEVNRIRKLTPKECWRLMGFDDEDFEKAEKVNSNTQLYKQAGNSIVVNVLEAILRNLLEPCQK
jgi:DNA (cytosine-5)-methyltransferase 1